ncbi:MAG: hypothetical protein ACHQRM_01210 [Bacteroidia bacterium]
MRFRAIYLLLLLPVFLSSCFDLVEELTLHPDGSGTYLFEANLSQSKTKLNALLTLDSMDGIKIPSREMIRKDITKARQVLAASEGISMVNDKINFEDYIFSMQFDFKNITSLNKALLSLRKAFPSKESRSVPAAFKLEGNTFTRLNEYEGRAEIKKLPPRDSSMLDNAFLTCIYRFDKGIKTSSNTNARISKNGKAVLLKVTVSELLNGKKKLSNTILLQD